ncbi:hypothetical protein K461DRAFT_162598 [Myriangium duriaei CBS 260.36]|uniref:Uncharacterized protein n=1 Tax=Myriangium duriaei CBS 260.36 TaxID=1168546 RepID=A0A9P4J491_9PEZI|nr:hypothetical protein K461DRAFT_162598 [Myriangium duriaei CBS 260.36]
MNSSQPMVYCPASSPRYQQRCLHVSCPASRFTFHPSHVCVTTRDWTHCRLQPRTMQTMQTLVRRRRYKFTFFPSPFSKPRALRCWGDDNLLVALHASNAVFLLPERIILTSSSSHSFAAYCFLLSFAHKESLAHWSGTVQLTIRHQSYSPPPVRSVLLTCLLRHYQEKSSNQHLNNSFP